MMKELIDFAKSYGIEVLFKSFKSSADGLMVGTDDGGFIIALSDKLTGRKAEEILAHEIAHVYLHKDKGNTIESPMHKDYEEQADRAANMLLDFMDYIIKAPAPTKAQWATKTNFSIAD